MSRALCVPDAWTRHVFCESIAFLERFHTFFFGAGAYEAFGGI